MSLNDEANFMVEAEIATAPTINSDNDDDKHPWPYLREMCTHVREKESLYWMKCFLCSLKDTEILAFKNSPSDLYYYLVIIIWIILKPVQISGKPDSHLTLLIICDSMHGDCSTAVCVSP